MTNSTVTDPVMIYDAIPLRNPNTYKVIWVANRCRPIYTTEAEFHKNMKRVKGERV